MEWVVFIVLVVGGYILDRNHKSIMNELQEIRSEMAKDPQVQFEKKWSEEDPDTFADYQATIDRK